MFTPRYAQPPSRFSQADGRHVWTPCGLLACCSVEGADRVLPRPSGRHREDDHGHVTRRCIWPGVVVDADGPGRFYWTIGSRARQGPLGSSQRMVVWDKSHPHSSKAFHNRRPAVAVEFSSFCSERPLPSALLRPAALAQPHLQVFTHGRLAPLSSPHSHRLGSLTSHSVA